MSNDELFFWTVMRQELAYRYPDYADECLAGKWDNSVGMRKVIEDAKTQERKLA